MTYPALDKGSTASTSATPKRYAGYTVYDPLGQKIGNAEEVFVNLEGEPEYIRVRIGFFGRSGSTEGRAKTRVSRTV